MSMQKTISVFITSVILVSGIAFSANAKEVHPPKKTVTNTAPISTTDKK